MLRTSSVEEIPQLDDENVMVPELTHEEAQMVCFDLKDQMTRKLRRREFRNEKR